MTTNAIPGQATTRHMPPMMTARMQRILGLVLIAASVVTSQDEASRISTWGIIFSIIGVAAFLIICAIVFYVVWRRIISKRYRSHGRNTGIENGDHRTPGVGGPAPDAVSSRPVKTCDLAEYIASISHQPDKFKKEHTCAWVKMMFLGGTAPMVEEGYYANTKGQFPYIHASFLKGYPDRPRAFIISPAPVKRTAKYLWRLVFETKAACVISFMTPEEHQEVSWLPSGSKDRFGSYIVKQQDIRVFIHWRSSDLTVTYKGDTHHCKYLQYTAWQPRVEPSCAASLLDFWCRTRPFAGTSIVFSGSGSDRAGTYIALDYCLQQAENEAMVDACAYTVYMRQLRQDITLYLKQLKFLYTATNEYVQCEEARKSKKRDVEFKTLEKVKAEYRNQDIDDMQGNANLLAVVDPESEVDAVYVDGPNHGRAFIVSSLQRLPSQKSLEHFWQLMLNQNSCILVVLTESEEDNTMYWPLQFDDPLLAGDIQVQLEKEIPLEHDTVKELTVSGKAGQFLRVHQFLGRTWAEDCKLPPEAFQQLVTDVHACSLKSQGNPIMIASSTGYDQSGVLCAALYLLSMEPGRAHAFEAVRAMRLSRPGFSKNKEEYDFLCDLSTALSKRRKKIQGKQSNPVTGLKGGARAVEDTALPVVTSRPVKTRDLADYMSNISQRPDQFKREYLQVAAVVGTIAVEDPGFNNSAMTTDGSPDRAMDTFVYISASHLKGYPDRTKTFTISPAPVKQTAEYFWWMVFESKAACLISFVTPEELESNPYLSREGRADFGSYNVNQDCTRKFIHWRSSELTVTHQGEAHRCTYLQYTAWQSRVEPLSVASLLNFWLHARSYADLGVKLSIVISSSGLCRAGTFIALDYCLRQAENEAQIDAWAYVVYMRSLRQDMELHLKQYKCLYTAAHEHIQCIEATKSKKRDVEYKTLDKLRPAFANQDIDDMSGDANLLAVVDQASSVDAVFVDGPKHGRAFITASLHPLPSPQNLEDFWQLMLDQKTRTLVALTGMEQGSEKYWPHAISVPVQAGRIQVRLEEETHMEYYLVRELIVSGKTGQSLCVRLFHGPAWPDSSRPQVDAVQQLVTGVHAWEQEPREGPITIVCSTGYHSGVVCAGLYLHSMPPERANVFQAVKVLHLSRPEFIKNQAEYDFMCDLASALAKRRKKKSSAHWISMDRIIGVKGGESGARAVEDTALPVVTSRSVQTRDLAEFISNISQRPAEFKKEYMQIDVDAAAMAQKNFGFKSVTMTEEIYYEHVDEGFSYIDASYLKGYPNRAQAFIISPAPARDNTEPFWRMVVETKAAGVISFMTPEEHDDNPYWPCGHQTDFGSYTVEQKDIRRFIHWRSADLKVTYRGVTHRCKYLQYTAWQSLLESSTVGSLLLFWMYAKRYADSGTKLSVVVSGSGLGRAGTYIALDYCLHQIENEAKVDAYPYVVYMRSLRRDIELDLKQYKFLYTAMYEHIQCVDAMQSRNTVVEYKTLDKIKPTYEHQDTELISGNANMLALADPANVVDAVFVNGPKYGGAFITAGFHHLPSEQNLEDFWRMMLTHKSSTLVVLTEMDECSVKYWPDQGNSTLEAGKIKVELETENWTEHYKIRELKVSDKLQRKQPVQVRQFHSAAWPDYRQLPSSTEALRQLVTDVHAWGQESGRGPVTIACSTGYHQSGVVCAALYLRRMTPGCAAAVFQAVRVIRLSRPGFIKNLAEYQFLCDLSRG